jgi:DNA-binding FadR family transcriptional regulator
MKTVIPEPIKIKRLSEIIETHIRSLIVDGDITVGERLPTEKEIARQFGVSIVTMREALKGLEASGLIEKKKGKGGGVFATSPKSDIVKKSIYSFLISKKFSSQHLTELRLIIEPVAARIAAERITSWEIKGLERNVRYSETKFNEISSEERKQKNIEFHRLVAEATKNPVLSLTTDFVMDFLFEYKIRPLPTSVTFIKNTVREHQNVLERLKAHDPKGAEDSMTFHLKSVESFLVRTEAIK